MGQIKPSLARTRHFPGNFYGNYKHYVVPIMRQVLSQRLTHLNPESSQQPYKVGIVINLILQMRKMRHREIQTID